MIILFLCSELYTFLQWARDLGLRCNPPVKIPAYPANHYYAVASPPSLQTSLNLPCIRDFDSHSYMREWKGDYYLNFNCYSYCIKTNDQ